MGQRGPAPTPSSTLRLRGTARSDRIYNEPVPPKDPPEPPDWLDEAGREVWDQLAPNLRASGLLTVLDVNTLARYCHTWVRWRAAEDFIAMRGPVYPIMDGSGELKYVQQFPQVSIAHKLAALLTRMEAEFGMTPSARSRIHMDPRLIPGEMSEESLRKSRHFAGG